MSALGSRSFKGDVGVASKNYCRTPQRLWGNNESNNKLQRKLKF